MSLSKSICAEMVLDRQKDPLLLIGGCNTTKSLQTPLFSFFCHPIDDTVF
jgi:hypothetical protein